MTFLAHVFCVKVSVPRCFQTWHRTQAQSGILRPGLRFNASRAVDVVEADVLKAAADAGLAKTISTELAWPSVNAWLTPWCTATGYNKNKHVHVNVMKSASDFTVRITDQGEGFEAEMVPDPLDGTNILRHSGRGLFLMAASWMT